VNVQKKIEDLERTTQELDQKIDSITLSIASHEEERARFVAVVPAELINDYEHMRGQVINPLCLSFTIAVALVFTLYQCKIWQS